MNAWPGEDLILSVQGATTCAGATSLTDHLTTLCSDTETNWLHLKTSNTYIAIPRCHAGASMQLERLMYSLVSVHDQCQARLIRVRIAYQCSPVGGCLVLMSALELNIRK